MNKISELRQRVRQNGSAVITAEEYDKLQEEWITRCLDSATETDEIERLHAVVLAAEHNALLNSQKLVSALAELERLRAEVAFLHQRRGEIAIERDRYKAALGKYPEGRDVFLGGALAEIERLRAALGENSD